MDFVLTAPLASAAFELNPLDAAVGVPFASVSFEINPLSVGAAVPFASAAWSITAPGVLDFPLTVPLGGSAFEILSPGEVSFAGALPFPASATQFANDGFALTAPLVELAGEIETVPYVTIGIVPPSPSLSLDITSAGSVSFDLALPAVSAIWDIGGFDVALPIAAATMAIDTHGAFSADAQLPLVSAGFDIVSSATPMSIAGVLPFAGAAASISSTSISIVAAAPLPAIDFRISSGSALSFAFEVPFGETSADIGASVPMSFAIELPAARGEFFVGAPVSTVASAYWAGAMNARNFGVTEYTGFAFNSFATFAGKQIAAGAGGLFELGGATDAGTAIDADVVSGRTNFGALYKSRISRIYVTVATSGSGEVVTVTPFDGRRAYAIPSPQTDDTQQRFVRIGRGVKSHAWQVGYSNREGADFVLYGIDPRPEFTYRRAA